MKDKFSILSKKEEQKLSQQERILYYKQLRNYVELNGRIENLTKDQRDKIFPFIRIVFKLDNLFKGNKIHILGDQDKIKKIKEQYPDKAIIFVNTHIGQPDVEIAGIVLNEHFYLLSGDFENLHLGIDGKFLGLNGVNYYFMFDKEEKSMIKEKNIKTLDEFINLLYYVEQTWNFSPNLPVLDTKYGVVETVHKSKNAIIVPLAMEQYDKHFYVKIGDPFDTEKYYKKYSDEETAKKEAIYDLRDILATLKWDIWENNESYTKKDDQYDEIEWFLYLLDNCYHLYKGGILTKDDWEYLKKVRPVKRDSIELNYWKKYIEMRLSEWNFSLEEVLSKEFNSLSKKGTVSEYEAFKHITDSINYNSSNAFLLSNRENKQTLINDVADTTNFPGYTKTPSVTTPDRLFINHMNKVRVKIKKEQV